MSEEPTYTFIKGQGWQPTKYETLTFTWNGKQIDIVAKKPEIGELGIEAWEDDPYYCPDGKLSLERLSAWFESYCNITKTVDIIRVTQQKLDSAAKNELLQGKKFVWVTYYVRG